MALTFGFYNSINHDRRYDAVQVGQIFDGIIQDGVYRSYKSAMMPKESSQDNQIIIQPGRAWFDHTWSYNDSDLSVTMPEPEAFLNRIDAVVLEINSQQGVRANSIKVLQGTASDDPQKPNLIRTVGCNQYPLCYVTRYGGQNHINTADIEIAIGTSECPFVIGAVEGITVDQLLVQWNAEFDSWKYQQKVKWNAFQEGSESRISKYESNMEQQFFSWMEAQKRNYSKFLDHNEIAWNRWFSHIKTELDGDVAGHLQSQIDDIAKFKNIYVVDKTLFLPRSGVSVVDKKLIFAI